MGRKRQNKIYRCDFDGCARVFPRNYNLQVHRRVHSENTPFKCTVEGCEKAFRWKSSLQCHAQSHERNMEKEPALKPIVRRPAEKLVYTDSTYALYDISPDVKDMWMGDNEEEPRYETTNRRDTFNPLDVETLSCQVDDGKPGELSNVTDLSDTRMGDWDAVLFFEESRTVSSKDKAVCS
uniref:C2H2-type domain-containing protein n=1 Tax=Rhodosorus marinus TaxID=101924 RepID=A0A7S2ZH93_9RHOD|mmetsp:Transcript_17031/g.69265  ORF Transcript_17031/g.69265 Transcript_17031/m.69265 type:complete len:180 (+) Transcript_17031:86-625(+)